MGWTLGDPHMKVGEPDVQDYDIAQTEGGKVPPGLTGDFSSDG